MMQIEITGITGSGLYQIYVCDTTLTYCTLAAYPVTIPPDFTYILSYPIDSVPSVIIKIIDLLTGCETFQLYTCPPPSPTPTPTLTPTTTPSNCRCIQFQNTTLFYKEFSYIQCNGSSFAGLIAPSTILYFCGSSPSAVSGVLFNINLPCVDGTNCFPIPPPPSQTPTNSVTPTLTPTPTTTPTSTP